MENEEISTNPSPKIVELSPIFAKIPKAYKQKLDEYCFKNKKKLKDVISNMIRNFVEEIEETGQINNPTQPS